MATAAWHDLGSLPGACTVCGATGSLTTGEVRVSLTLLERLRGDYCPAPARFLTCRDCGWRWAVRASDSGADGVRGRTDLPVPRARRGPERASAARTVLPQQRPGRDWAYPSR